eukprot:gnl/TRDRNA2_/TRDRNA2_125977_c0_seq1.p1 gnl/TRDRNA2_/TRDRNA2_125977_c0~~gnl/TRDRNA2_/TRDRNA2_125977_c0_seq1.p1  ORF type:complete len:131 (+),score=19.67 gnl/TRDRNA2_/TRDRNA2_125977_c0_seq1:79-471(+)
MAWLHAAVFVACWARLLGTNATSPCGHDETRCEVREEWRVEPGMCSDILVYIDRYDFHCKDGYIKKYINKRRDNVGYARRRRRGRPEAVWPFECWPPECEQEAFEVAAAYPLTYGGCLMSLVLAASFAAE